MNKKVISVSIISLLIVLLATGSFLILNKTKTTPSVIQPMIEINDHEEVDSVKKEGEVEASNLTKEDLATENSEAVSLPWKGEWTRNIKFASGSLQIQDISDSSFSFRLNVSSGANIGELEGAADINGDRAIAIIENDMDWGSSIQRAGDCIVRFYKNGDKIEINANTGCQYWAGAGVTFSGEYENGLPKELESTLEDFVFDTAEQDARFRELVGEDYKLFTDNFMSVGEQEDLDGLNVTVRGGFIRGLANSNYGIIMFNDEYMWAAVSDFQNDEVVVRYYTNHPKYRDKLPQSIEGYIQDRYSEIIYP